MAYNQVTLCGRMTRDPELRYTNNQVPVVSFTLAVDRRKKEDPTDYIDCVAWKNTAEFISKYFVKGSKALVGGRLQIREWEDKEGNKRRSAEVIIDEIDFASDRPNGVRSPSREEIIDSLEEENILPF